HDAATNASDFPSPVTSLYNSASILRPPGLLLAEQSRSMLSATQLASANGLGDTVIVVFPCPGKKDAPHASVHSVSTPGLSHRSFSCRTIGSLSASDSAS